MMNVTYDKKSWHYHLATEYSGFHGYDWHRKIGGSQNICDYFKHVLLGMANVIGIVIIISAILTVSLCYMPWVVWVLMNHYVEPLWIFYMIWISEILIIFYIVKDKTPSFISNAFDSISNKICFRVNFK